MDDSEVVLGTLLVVARLTAEALDESRDYGACSKFASHWIKGKMCSTGGMENGARLG